LDEKELVQLGVEQKYLFSPKVGVAKILVVVVIGSFN
jgi:hypothetical protein